MTLYREFTLSNATVWRNLVAFVKSNAKAAADARKPLRIIITQAQAKRRSEQNAFYWSAVITPVSEQGWVGGKRFSKDVWHEMFARLFGVCEDVKLPSGEVITRRLSTTDMTVSQFSEYAERVQAYAATEYGVQFQ